MIVIDSSSESGSICAARSAHLPSHLLSAGVAITDSPLFLSLSLSSSLSFLLCPLTANITLRFLFLFLFRHRHQALHYQGAQHHGIHHSRGVNRRARSFSVPSLVFVWHLSFRPLIALLRTWSWLDWTGMDWTWMVRVDLGCVYFYFLAGVGGGEAGGRAGGGRGRRGKRVPEMAAASVGCSRRGCCESSRW
ncbi:hypothetical protein IWZ03DRAFT_188537 [Phyllosticta citriasiana]|uniref:Uncharacterized protein n=1 Tax=Phyllosticta citriasiana TaxID=595635 RepID=A0ABR1KPU6_9PEZI